MEPGVKPGLKLNFRALPLDMQPRAPFPAAFQVQPHLEVPNSGDRWELSSACKVDTLPKCGTGKREAVNPTRDTTGGGLEFNTGPSRQNQCVAKCCKKLL